MQNVNDADASLNKSQDFHPEDGGGAIVKQVLPYAGKRSFDSGEPILEPGSETEVFYYVGKGAVEVGYTDRHETRITVALIGSGEFFGEIGFFDGESRVRDIQASGPAEIAVFDRPVMERMRTDDPGLYTDFIVYLTKRICSKFRRIAGEREPLSAYASSLSSRRSSSFAESKPLPASLANSSQWHLISSQVELARGELFDLSHRLQENEAKGIEDKPSEQSCYQVLDKLIRAMPEFREMMKDSGYEDVLWGYIFKEIYPYFMRSRFAERSYFKPKGYAGDFLMMEHIYKNVPEGDGKLGEIIDAFCLQRPASNAIRGRRRLLKNQLAELSKPIADRGENVRIMNLACGPNRELFDFLAECEYSEAVEALCVDIDSEALQYTNQYVNVFPHRASIRLMSENVIKWALGRVTHQIDPLNIIYSAGLCDYLDKGLFRALITQCYNHLKPGGSLVLGNFARHRDAIFMDNFLKWGLIYRSAEDLMELFAATPFGDNVVIISEKEQVNLFALATKN